MVRIDESLWFWLRLSGTGVWSRSWPVLDKCSTSELQSTQSFPFILHRDKVTSCTQAILEQEFGFPHISSARIPALCKQPTWLLFMSVWGVNSSNWPDWSNCTPTGTVRRITVLCPFLTKPSPGLFLRYGYKLFQQAGSGVGVAHAFNSSSWEAEADQPGLYSEF